MTESETHGHPSNFIIWVWLVVLLAVGLAVAFLPMGTITVLSLVFGVALVKATLVARYYMHLVSEDVLIYAIAGVPILLALGFVFTLIPDVVLTPH